MGHRLHAIDRARGRKDGDRLLVGLGAAKGADHRGDDLGSGGTGVKTTSLQPAMLVAGDDMRAAQGETGRREALNLRIRPEVRELIDRAAELAGKNRTDFVLEAA